MAPARGKKSKVIGKKHLAKAAEREEQMKKEAMLSGDGPKRHAVLEQAVVTGNLASRPDSLDLKIDQFSVVTYGRPLVQDTTLELNFGRRYGLIGGNGSGKTTILAAIAAREIPIPKCIDMWHLDTEAPPSDLNAIEAVIEEAQKEHDRLEALTMTLLEDDPTGEEHMELLEQIGDKLGKMDVHTFEPRACNLLHGLGFTKEMMNKATKDMSGGWRMRVALAQALFVEPTLLLLDEPTNHLDLGACVWLEDYLKTYPYTLVIISHSQDFLNGVCTNILQLTQKGTLVTWGGNYDQYIQTRTETEKNQMTKYKKEQDDIKHLNDFIRSCGTFANLRKQADSKQKIIDKMVEAGLTEKPAADPVYQFAFPDTEKLSPPVMAFHDVSFAYSGRVEDYLYQGLNFGIDCDSRIALVGPNGAGKSTLLKLMRQELAPCEGDVKRHGHLRIGQYNQHSEEVLDLELSPLEFFQRLYEDGVHMPDGKRKLELEEWRSQLGRFGIKTDYQTRPMKTMSDGYRSRVVMMMIALTNPHMLLLDEPTNHLDMQCIDALANAINNFRGGLVLVSHDFRLISQVAKEIWVCDDKTLTTWDGDIQSYKEHLRKQA